MVNCIIVVDRAEPVNMLRAILPAPLVQGLKFMGKPKFSDRPVDLISAATTLQVSERKPVVLLVDTQTIDIRAFEDRRSVLEELMRINSGGIPFKIVPFVPAIEVLLFKVPGLVSKIFQQPISEELELLGRSNPQAALSRLFGKKGAPKDLRELLDHRLTDVNDIQALRSTAPIPELIAFLNDVSASDSAETRQLAQA